jgi:FkbM family methyltransferase
MLSMDTATKIRLGRALYAAVRAARRLTGHTSDTVVCRRQGLLWELDLAEGIDLSLYLFGAFDRDADRALRHHLRSGMVALDIGANVGGHALPMARLLGPEGRVYAFEPTEWAYARLARNLALNPQLAQRLVPVHAALVGGPDAPRTAYYSSWSFNATGPVHEIHRGSLQPSGNARSATLDALVGELGLQRLDFIKLDVDGHETEVLAGARETLSRFAPPILFELCPHSQEEHGTTAVAFLDVMRSHGYSFRDLRGDPFSANAEVIRRRLPRWGSINLVAVAARSVPELSRP